MRILFLWFACIASAVVSYAQTEPARETPHGIVVEKQGWDEFRRDLNMEIFPSRPTGLNIIPMPYIPRIVKGFEYRVRVKNTGERTVKALGWDYLFIDPTTKKAVARHPFVNLMTIHPNKKSTLVQETASPPTRIVTASALEKHARNPFEEQVVIRCVAFTDGTVWSDAGTEPSRCIVVKRYRLR